MSTPARDDGLRQPVRRAHGHGDTVTGAVDEEVSGTLGREEIMEEMLRELHTHFLCGREQQTRQAVRIVNSDTFKRLVHKRRDEIAAHVETSKAAAGTSVMAMLDAVYELVHADQVHDYVGQGGLADRVMGLPLMVEANQEVLEVLERDAAPDDQAAALLAALATIGDATDDSKNRKKFEKFIDGWCAARRRQGWTEAKIKEHKDKLFSSYEEARRHHRDSISSFCNDMADSLEAMRYALVNKRQESAAVVGKKVKSTDDDDDGNGNGNGSGSGGGGNDNSATTPAVDPYHDAAMAAAATAMADVAITGPMAWVGTAVAGPAIVAAGDAGGHDVRRAAVDALVGGLNTPQQQHRRANDPTWFERVRSKIVGYLKGTVTRAEMQETVLLDGLEQELSSFSECYTNWAASTLTRLRAWRVPQLSEDAVMAELHRSWSFIRAVALGGAPAAAKHKAMLRKVVGAALENMADTDAAPVVSVGVMQEGAEEVHLTVWCPSPSDDPNLEELAAEFKAAFNGIFHTTATVTATYEDIPREDGDDEDEDEEENKTGAAEPAAAGGGAGVGAGAGFGAGAWLDHDKAIKYRVSVPASCQFGVKQLVSRLADMARIQVRCVMLGEFDITAAKNVMNPAWNRMYHRSIEVPGFRNVWWPETKPLLRGDKPYFFPNGWRRFSLNVAASAEEFDAKYGDWAIAYHGTNAELATAILTDGIIATPQGDKGKPYIYLSPSIEYSGHQRYANVRKVNGKYVQMVLQVRVNLDYTFEGSKVFARQLPSTLPGTLTDAVEGYDPNLDVYTADPNFPGNEGLEWLLTQPPGAQLSDYIVVYGIMVRVTNKHPQTLPHNKWWYRPGKAPTLKQADQ